LSEETTFRHGSDWIEWLEATGRQGARRRPVSPQGLSITLSQAPPDLRMVHSRSGTKLWRERMEGSTGIQTKPLDTHLIPDAPTALFDVAGVFIDPAGIFLPRVFAFKAGDGNGHAVSLFRSPLGTRFVTGCGLRGTVLFADGTSAAWALVQVRVTPPVGAPLDFKAQADAYGDFLLPMDRVPALTKDAPSATYSTELRVFALPGRDSPLDPDTLPPVNLATGMDGSGHPIFGQKLTFDLSPGTLTPLQSPGIGHLAVQAG